MHLIYFTAPLHRLLIATYVLLLEKSFVKMDGNHAMMLKKKSLNLVLFPFVILNVVMENVEPLTFVPVKLVGKAHIVILVYLCQAVIMDIAKLPLNVFVRMDGMVLIVIPVRMIFNHFFSNT